MRALRCAAATIGIIASVIAGPAGVSTASAVQHSRFSVVSVQPAPGTTVGVAHPVVVRLDGPVVDRAAAEQAIGVTAVPPMTGRYEWLGSDLVQWVPDEFWPAHRTVALSVGGRPTTFTTGPRVIGVASIAEHTFTVTIDGVDAGQAELPAPHHRPRWGESGVFPASMGRPEYPTPVGIYPVLAKERSVLMDSSSVGIPVDSPDGYRLNVDYAVRFTARGLFVHSAPWAENSLGHSNVSHGCVSLSVEDAEWYFNIVNVGDPVVVRENSLEVPRERPVTQSTWSPARN